MATDIVRINGNAYSWGSIIAKIDNERYHGFRKVTFGQTRARQHIYGMGKSHKPRGVTRGKYIVKDSKLGGPLDAIEALINGLSLKATDGASYGNVKFEVVIQAIEEGLPPVNVTLESCYVTDEDASFEEGEDGLEEEITIKPTGINRAGRVLYDRTNGAT